MDTGHGSAVENVEFLDGDGHALHSGVLEADIGDFQRQRFKKIDVPTGGNLLNSVQQAVVGNNGGQPVVNGGQILVDGHFEIDPHPLRSAALVFVGADTQRDDKVLDADAVSRRDELVIPVISDQGHHGMRHW